MKRNLIAIILCFICTVSFGQNAEVNELLSSIKDKYQTDMAGNVYVQSIIELESDVSKDKLYSQLKEIITAVYVNSNYTTKVDDKENGLIVCKGTHKDKCTEIFYGSNIPYTITHILKLKIKDNKVKVTISATHVNETTLATYVNGIYIPSCSIDRMVSEMYPFKDQGRKNWNSRDGYIFYRTIIRFSDLIAIIKTQLNNSTDYNIGDGGNW